MLHTNRQFLAKLNRVFGGNLNESALNFPLYSTGGRYGGTATRTGDARSTLYGDTNIVAPAPPGTYIEWTETQADAVGGYLRCNHCDLDGTPVTVDIGMPDSNLPPIVILPDYFAGSANQPVAYHVPYDLVDNLYVEIGLVDGENLISGQPFVDWIVSIIDNSFDTKLRRALDNM